MEGLIQIIGWVGAIILLLAFFVNINNYYSSKSKQYLLLNFTGSLLLIINALYNSAYPFVLVNTIWMIFSSYKLLQMIYKKDSEAV